MLHFHYLLLPENSLRVFNVMVYSSTQAIPLHVLNCSISRSCRFPLKAVKVMHTVSLRTEATIVGGETPPNLGQAFKVDRSIVLCCVCQQERGGGGTRYYNGRRTTTEGMPHPYVVQSWKE